MTGTGTVDTAAAAERVYNAGIAISRGTVTPPSSADNRISSACISAHDNCLALDPTQPQRTLRSTHALMVQAGKLVDRAHDTDGAKAAVAALSNLVDALMAEYDLPPPK